MTVAALFVYGDGPYSGLPGVEVWDEARDARKYAGPHPVVAHPPCAAWSILGNCRPEILKDDDGGCFEAALRCVRRYGGVLEHPAHTRAWARYGLPQPKAEGGWTRSLLDPGWSIEVDQRWYGHETNKPTWLYYVGDRPPPPLAPWRAPRGAVSLENSHRGGRFRGVTPAPFREVLLGMARKAA